MTTSELDTIPKAQWNALIAERCEWTHDYLCADEYEQPCVAWRSPDGRGPFGDSYLPNFTGSLDTCAQFEAMLREMEDAKSVHNRWRSYLLNLMSIVNPGVKLWERGTFIGSWDNAIRTATATTEQRCRAFLLTVL